MRLLEHVFDALFLAFLIVGGVYVTSALSHI